jgi:hypothetical protein
MFAYGIGILPLIRQLKKEFPLVEQPWYTDNAGAGGKFDRIRSQFLRLVKLGPTFGYFPESTKSILIVAQHNLESATSVFVDLHFKVKTGERYLGGFIDEPAAQDEWLDRKIQYWSKAMAGLAVAAAKFPQSAYSGLQRSLQQEWQFVQRIVKDIGGKFPFVEKEMNQTFLPALCDDAISSDDPRFSLAGLPVKHAGLALPNPVLSANKNYESSMLSLSHILAAFCGVNGFRSADHIAIVREV